MTGDELKILCTGLNGGHPIDETLLFQFVNIGCAIIEGERPWMVLRKTDTSLTVSASAVSAWDTAIDLGTAIPLFNRFYGNTPIKIYNGTTLVEERWRVPFDERLAYKDDSGTFCYDESTGFLYLNGINAGGTLNIAYIKNSPTISVSSTDIWPRFESRLQPLLGFYAVGAYKGAVDWDEVVKNQLPENQEIIKSIKSALVMLDAEKQQEQSQNVDYADHSRRGGFRPNSINFQ
jgi:hypothetical protein